MEKIVVTGATGLVGKALKRLAEDDPRSAGKWTFLGSKDCDLRDPHQVAERFSELRPTHVFHLAAKVGGLFYNIANNGEMFEDNVLMNVNVLGVCKQLGVRKVMSCSSTCVFPAHLEGSKKHPLIVEDLHEGLPHHSNLGYAFAKRMLDVQNRLYRSETSKFFSIIPTNIFGKDDAFDEDRAHVIPALIGKCYRAMMEGSTFVIAG